MKKTISLTLVLIMLLSSLCSCNGKKPDESDKNIDKNDNNFNQNIGDDNGNDEQKDNGDKNIDNNDNNYNQNIENNQADTSSKKLTLSEYQKLVGCYVTTESGKNLEHLMNKDKAKIKVAHEAYGSNLFYITTVQDGIEYKTTISLSEGIRTPDIYSGFTSNQNGYVIIFHMEGYSVSPMDSIELACLLTTNDGGKTWNKTEYSDFYVSDSREYILGACFFTEDVGFFTSRCYNTDHFGPRTHWTVDGGKTWSQMPRVDLPNVLEPFGFNKDDFSTEISDVELVNGVYTITVRICHGKSLKFADLPDHCSIYIKCSSEDLVNWTLIS